AAACAASAAVAATLAVVVVAQLDRGPRPTEVAAAVLDPLSPSVSTARAEVIERDGQRLLVVDADALPQTDGYLDVWLLDAQAQQMVSLGVMDSTTAQLALPADLDLAAFPIVDVSVEPYDGDPTHSGDSIWRGALGG
ncbi:anti-sigma factor, partial [Agrococcus sp. HG114]|uniref:anti-sigma factor n=1 Tax=Agrococcus sp. HG114 TaxID=2969757 RepID=UPI00215B228F